VTGDSLVGGPGLLVRSGFLVGSGFWWGWFLSRALIFGRVGYVFEKVGQKGVGMLCIVHLRSLPVENLVNGEQTGEPVLAEG